MLCCSGRRSTSPKASARGGTRALELRHQRCHGNPDSAMSDCKPIIKPSQSNSQGRWSSGHLHLTIGTPDRNDCRPGGTRLQAASSPCRQTERLQSCRRTLWRSGRGCGCSGSSRCRPQGHSIGPQHWQRGRWSWLACWPPLRGSLQPCMHSQHQDIRCRCR